MTVTIKGIAKVAGVSHSTVSRALSGHPAIATETITRIKQIASDLGYVPSAVARGLKTSRSLALGVIVRRIDDPFFSEILQGIEEVSHEAGYSLFVAASNRDHKRERAIVQAMGERRVDGIIVCSTRLGEEQGRQLQKFGVPIVVVDNQSLDTYQYSIYHDDFYGSCQVTQHLLDIGHKKIAYLGNERSGRTNQDRLNGFRHTIEAAQCNVADEYIFHAPDGRPNGGMVGAKYFLTLLDPPTAIFCFNDMMAIGVLHTLQGAGVRVPEDCSVAGFDNIGFSAYTIPSLTTFDQPKYQLGHKAAQMMMKLLDPESEETHDVRPETLVLRGKKIVRKSTAPPP